MKTAVKKVPVVEASPRRRGNSAVRKNKTLMKEAHALGRALAA